MRLLAADTSTSINTVAICDGDRLLAETIVECERKHAERLLETVDWVLDEVGLGLGDLDALAISGGPGSFTGLRIGVAAWKGLAAGTNLPLVTVPTLDAMARLGMFLDATVCPVLDAKMGEVYGAVYRFEEGTRTKITADRVCRIEALIENLRGAVWFLGNGAAVYRERIVAVVPHAVFAPTWGSIPRAGAVAAEALALLAQGARGDPALAVPVYLRRSQAERKRDGAAMQ